YEQPPEKANSSRSPRCDSNVEETMDMFFDFNSAISLMPQRPVDSQLAENLHESMSRLGAVRVSLACIPCRDRHVKCDAKMPNCGRCVRNGKLCSYTKSRRGMRDRRAAQGKPTLQARPLPEASLNPQYARLSGQAADPRRLLDLYYSFFHKAHPFVLPRHHFLSRLGKDSKLLKHLLPVINYIGSLYAPDISSPELREMALRQLDMVDIPPNGFTVLALLLLGIALYCEDGFGQARTLVDRGTYMALELRMNSKAFANMERDPVLAESWRRTYWGLYTTSAIIAGNTRFLSFPLYYIEADVELPCEEYEYDRIIPRPRTVFEYEARDIEDEESFFSSFTYLIGICRISGFAIGLQNLSGDELELAVANVDTMLVNWKLHLPRGKQDISFRMMLYIHRPLSQLYQVPTESISNCASLPSTCGTNRDENASHWLHTRKCLEAARTA
ncbi:hypothetical protein B0O99DRAFT_646320, partial [Bisporella sp. PMI_857]